MRAAKRAIGEREGLGASPPANDPYARYRFLGRALAALILVASINEFWRNVVHPSDRDFLGVWSAGRLALGGHSSAAYDNGLLHAVEAAAATFSPGAQLPFPYPPAYLLLAIPFALPAFPAAMIAWVSATFAFYLHAARRLMPGSGWLPAAFPAVFANAAIGQNGFLTAGLFMTGLSLLGTAPLSAGLVLGCLVVKPQLAILLPVALIAGRHWRAVAGAAVSSIGILALGFVAFGPATTMAWLHEAPLIVKVTGDGLMGWSKLASVYAAARQAGLAAGPAIWIHGLVAAATAVLVWRSWRSKADQGSKVAILAAGSMLMSPYVFYYDALILIPAFLYLARRGVSPAILLSLWCIPLITFLQAVGIANIANLNPLLPIGLMVLTCRNVTVANTPANHANLTVQQPSEVRISQRVWG